MWLCEIHCQCHHQIELILMNSLCRTQPKMAFWVPISKKDCNSALRPEESPWYQVGSSLWPQLSTWYAMFPCCCYCITDKGNDCFMCLLNPSLMNLNSAAVFFFFTTPEFFHGPIIKASFSVLKYPIGKWIADNSFYHRGQITISKHIYIL